MHRLGRDLGKLKVRLGRDLGKLGRDLGKLKERGALRLPIREGALRTHHHGRTILPARNLTVREVLAEKSRYFPSPVRYQQMQRWEQALEPGTVQAVMRIGPALDPDKDLDEDKIKVSVATAPTLPIAPLVEDATAPLVEAAREEQRRLQAIADDPVLPAGVVVAPVAVGAADAAVAVGVDAAAVAGEGGNTMLKVTRYRLATLTVLSCAIVTLSSLLVKASAWADEPKQRAFRSPASAAAALVDAARSDDLKQMTAILGPGGEDVVSSGDPVADNNGREDFTKRYDQMHRLSYDDQGHVILYVGADNWPFPIPIVKRGDLWVFDTPEGKHELQYRRIGRNELYTIDVLQELADAQEDYADLQKQSSGEARFAQKILSDPDKKNGLYWPTSGAEPESPIGPLIADATAEGYKRDPSGRPAPFHGYYYKVLTGQGADAPGGAHDYVVDGKMTRGFAFLAYPAEYRDSGVMTFMIDKQGVIVEKDLGPDTEKIDPTITSFNPDSTWSELQEGDSQYLEYYMEIPVPTLAGQQRTVAEGSSSN